MTAGPISGWGLGRCAVAYLFAALYAHAKDLARLPFGLVGELRYAQRRHAKHDTFPIAHVSDHNFH
jgi:hypothetical protein